MHRSRSEHPGEGASPSQGGTRRRRGTSATAAGQLEAARGRLEKFVGGRVREVGYHLECAEVALELGALRVAERELQLELRDRRRAPDAARGLRAVSGLADVWEALGDRTKAHGYRVLEARALGRPIPRPPKADPVGRAVAPVAPPVASGGNDAVAGADAAEAPVPATTGRRAWGGQGVPAPGFGDVGRFLHLFAGRDDVHARQWVNARGHAGYSPVERPMTHELVEAHLAGAQTLGAYQTRVDGTVAFFALDLDATKPALERARGDREAARGLRRAIAAAGMAMMDSARRVGLSLVLEDSGYKGRHLWGFLAEPLPVGLVRNLVKRLGRAVAPADERLAVECFPKQGQLRRGQLGNLIKLPLGVHLRTGRRAHLLGTDGRPTEDPWALLRGARLHTREDVMSALEGLRDVAGAVGALVDGDAAEGDRAPAPLPAEAVFTEADFEANPQVRAMIGGCAVVRALVERGLTRRRLVHEEQVVLRHTLGHVPMGTHAANYVFSRCPEIGTDGYLKSVLQGNPMSCAKIRKRIPEVTARVACHCQFRVRADHYPTPILHLDEARARGELVDRGDAEADGGGGGSAAEVVEVVARRYWHLKERVGRLEGELATCERALVRGLAALPGERLEEADGVTWLERGADGAAVIRWERARSEAMRTDGEAGEGDP